MEFFDADRVRRLLDPVALVEALRAAFADPGSVTVPKRDHHPIDEDREATLLVMPAWATGRWVGVKVVGHFPGNGALGLPQINGAYLFMDGTTGVPLAVMDGAALTRVRTAAASALAADYLAPARIEQHLLVGAGNVTGDIPRCYAAVRSVGLTRVWARRPEQAQALVDELVEQGLRAEVAPDLRGAVRSADVITAATSATSPLVLGEDVRAGAHVDLIGAFTPSMVEADESLITGSSLFVDVAAALDEAGDLVGPLRRGTLRREDVRATLADLAGRGHPGRGSATERTVFKSVGTSMEDLVAASLVWEAARNEAGGDG